MLSNPHNMAAAVQKLAAERRELLKYLLQVAGRGGSAAGAGRPPSLLPGSCTEHRDTKQERVHAAVAPGSNFRRCRRPSCRHSCHVQDTQARGRDVLLPVGCSGYDEWLLDALSVDRVLKQLRSSSAKLDLINACVSTSAIGGSLAAAARRESLATPPRGTSSGLEAPDSAVAFRQLVSGTPHGTPSGGGGVGAASEALEDEADSGVPQLRLRSLHVGELLAGAAACPPNGLRGAARGLEAEGQLVACPLCHTAGGAALAFLAALGPHHTWTNLLPCRAGRAPAQGAGLQHLPVLLRRPRLARPAGRPARLAGAVRGSGRGAGAHPGAGGASRRDQPGHAGGARQAAAGAQQPLCLFVCLFCVAGCPAAWRCCRLAPSFC